jgi:energy-coupling factor transport system permease protein
VLGLPLLALGAVLAAASLAVGASRERRSGHRRDRWQWPETVATAAGAVPAVVLVVAAAQGWPGIVPAPGDGLPALPLPVVAAVLLAAVPAWLTPRPREEDR